MQTEKSPARRGFFIYILSVEIKSNFVMKTFTSKIKRIGKRFLQYISFSIVLVFILMGSWCLPPKWIEKVIQDLKSKYTVENVIEDDWQK